MDGARFRRRLHAGNTTMMDMPADLPAPRLTSNAELVLSKRYYR